MATVKVFTPNFKHIIVKISPNMTLLQILEEASAKAELIADEHELKHHRTILDLSQMFRFSGLPSNCDLEMVTAKVPRKDTADNDVVIVLQTEAKGRLEGTFKPGQNLLEIITELSPEEGDLSTNPVIIYMRTDVQGTNLQTTDLKSLGLTSGRGLLRLIHKSAEELKTQANVSGPMAVRPVVKPDTTGGDGGGGSQAMKKESNNLNLIKSEKKTQIQTVPEDDVKPGPSRMETEPSTTEEIIPQVPVKVEPPAKRNIEYTKEDLERLEKETKKLDDQNTVIYSLESIVHSSTADEIPDSFFDVTIGDIRVLMSQLRDNTRSMDNAPLMTSKLRELEDSKRTLNQLKYRETLIRIQFPNRFVLQTVFKPIDKIAAVKQFLKRYLIEEVGEFHLFTTPPKTILNEEDRLVELHFVPQALIHFSCDLPTDANVIKEEFFDRLSTAEAAGFLAAKLRGRIEMVDNNESSSASTNPGDEKMDTASSSANEENIEPKKRIVGTFKVSSTVTEKASLPKWFKPAK